MPVQVLSLILSVFLSTQPLASARAARADAAGPKKGCFDFSRKIVELPKKPTMLESATLPRISSKSGEIHTGLYWGAARGQVGRPIQDLIQDIAGHEELRSARVSKLDVQTLQSADYFIRQRVENTVTPFLFVKVSWKEDWAFDLLKGTQQDPKEVAVFYEKTEGTSHIEHLCGLFWLSEISPKITDVFLYEEAKATQRTQVDTVKGLIGSIRTMRYGRQD